MKYIFCLTVYFFSLTNLFGQNFFTEVNINEITNIGRENYPDKYKIFKIDYNTLLSYFSNVPKEFSDNKNKLIFPLPTPDGKYLDFHFVESSLFSNELSSKFPEIKSYLGYCKSDPLYNARLTIDKRGIHAMIINHSNSIYIDPISPFNNEYCIVYYKKDFYKTNQKKRLSNCVIDSNNYKTKKNQSIFSGDILRVYRIAIATTGEYSQFHGGNISDVLSAINVTLNRVNLVYEREASIRMILAENNDLIIYLDSSTDPYSNGNPGAMIDECQSNLDQNIGNANYDIGHVFGTNSGGLAGLGVVCLDTQKGRGVTGSSNPIGDPFDIDYVAHEIGHQFGASHTQNNSCNRSSNSSYEPGSGSTIMGYAGICPPNLQNNSDDYFHTISFDQIKAHSNGISFDIDCSQQIEIENNIPTSNCGIGNFTIPVNTPFELTGSGFDPDSENILTYCWEQFDLGPETIESDDNLINPSSSQPIFRSYSPKLNPIRIFPDLIDILNQTSTIGEILPSYSRELNFRLTVRDNHLGCGGVSYDSKTILVNELAGSFTVNDINDVWEYGYSYQVTWDVSNTNIDPINCSNVDIILSVDNGQSFTDTLASNILNDGNHEIICPQIVSDNARIKIKAKNNIFFNISNPFSIIESTNQNFSLNVGQNTQNICTNDQVIFEININSINNMIDPVSLSLTGLSSNIALHSFTPSIVIPGDNSQLIISSINSIPGGNYEFQLSGNSGDITHLIPIYLNVFDSIPVPPSLNFPNNLLTGVPLSPNFSWSSSNNDSSYEINISIDSTFENISFSESDIIENNFSLPVLLPYDTEIFWYVNSSNPCGISSNSEVFSFISAGENITEIYGCTDSLAFNFDPVATNDDGSCGEVVVGCTNSLADNFNSEANTDDGSCVISGCLNEVALNYNPIANIDDGSCIILGCTDPISSNFNMNANQDDGSCVSFIYGCTDDDAFNYNPSANINDGSCDYTSLILIQYEEEGGIYNFNAIINNLNNIVFIQWDFGDGNINSGQNNIQHVYNQNGFFTVTLNVMTFTGLFSTSQIINVNHYVYGCTDPNFINFNPLAQIEDGSCEEIINGCMDSLAVNFDIESNFDDNSCIYLNFGCIDSLALNFNIEANTDDNSCIYLNSGCTDTLAINFNIEANFDDNSCLYTAPLTPGWNVALTSNNHTILITQETQINISDNPIQNGDYIGVFYLNQNEEYNCAGFLEWNGSSNTISISGEDFEENNGYSIGDEFIWMTWDSSTNTTSMAIADYDSSFPNTNTYEVDGISSLVALSNTFSQDILLNENWNLISTYINPNIPLISEIFSPIQSDLILIKDELGMVYWPEYNIDNIIYNSIGKAYKIKMTNSTLLEIRGNEIEPSDHILNIPQGWSYLGYLRKNPGDISIILESITQDILLVKDELGNVYWPSFNVNTIGNMDPGSGYQIRMLNDVTLSYPSNDINIPQLRISKTEMRYFKEKISPKEFNATIVFPYDLINDKMKFGDEIGIFDQNNHLIGKSSYNLNTTIINLFFEKNNIGENFSIKFWSSNDNNIYSLIPLFKKNSPEILDVNRIFKVENYEIINETSNFLIMPNPVKSDFNIKFNLLNDQHVKVSILNLLGQEITVLLNRNLSCGSHLYNFKSDIFDSGLYFIKYSTKKSDELYQIHFQN